MSNREAKPRPPLWATCLAVLGAFVALAAAGAAPMRWSGAEWLAHAGIITGPDCTSEFRRYWRADMEPANASFSQSSPEYQALQVCCTKAAASAPTSKAFEALYELCITGTGVNVR